MKYKSTRGDFTVDNSLDGILMGIAPDGGLFVPESLPKYTGDLVELGELKYEEVAYRVLSLILDDIDEKNLRGMISRAYSDKFSAEDVLDIHTCGNMHFMELYHGPTSAFKDFALSILPQFISEGIKQRGVENKVAILTATSGDTGKAALEGFKDVENTEIIVFYPLDGVSDIQKYQMITQGGSNTHVVGIKGNFDDAQRALKSIFNDRELAADLKSKGIQLSSANSINIGRLLPQIVYYFYGYGNLVKNKMINPGDEVNISVPTGNFGDILGAYLAKEMGLPINKLICASNINNVLTEFFNTGTYNANREFFTTHSPSMDILVSSNLERLLYLASGRNGAMVREFMEKLNNEGTYTIGKDLLKALEDFSAYYVDEVSTLSTVRSIYSKFDYLIDTHTAVAVDAHKQYIEEHRDYRHTLIASTASPYKFTSSIGKALNIEGEDDFVLLEEIHNKTGVKIPQNLKGLNTLPITQKLAIEKNEIKSTVVSILVGEND